MKDSSQIYRNIGGVRFEQLTSNPAMFAELKKQSKALGLKCRVINNRTELIREITPTLETMNIRTAQKLYNRFSRLRHGGNYPSTKDKPEKFSVARVAELLAKEKPQTKKEWLRLVGCRDTLTVS